MQGIADLLTGEGIRFTDFEMVFSNKDRLMTIDEIYAIGPAISIMMSGYIEKDISDDPNLDRKLMWLRANRFKWTKLGRFFGFHRTTIKRRYETLLDKLCIKLKNNFYNLDKIFN